MTPPFFQCRPCGAEWPTRDQFLKDPGLEIIEYRANLNDVAAGAFIFCHTCGSNLSLSVRNFNGLYEGPIFNVHAKDAEKCPGYCLYKDNLKPCDVKCECAYVRNIIEIIKDWPKTSQ